MDDWQEAAFSSRHVHNRVNKNDGGSAKRHRKSAFDVKRTFGSYELNCPAAEKLAIAKASEKAELAETKGKAKNNKKKRGKIKETTPRLEIYRLSDEQDVLLGELFLPGVLEAGIALAGSRKGLEKAIAESRSNRSLRDGDGLPLAESASVSESEDSSQIQTNQEIEHDHDALALRESEDQRESGHGSSEVDQGSNSDDGQGSSDSSEQPESDNEETKQRRRFATFEKNSFRQPKFWLAWCGHVVAAAVSPFVESVTGAPTTTATNQSGMGYVVFSGNECRKFKGTISCEALGWEDVALEGWKRVAMADRETVRLGALHCKREKDRPRSELTCAKKDRESY